MFYTCATRFDVIGNLLDDRALAPVGKGCCPGSRAGAALPGLKAHPLVPVRGTGAKTSPFNISS